jgi:hypothetical protein
LGQRKGEALTLKGLLTPSEVTSLLEAVRERPGGTKVHCYYCPRDGSSETTVLEDGQPLSRWVCVEHALLPPKPLKEHTGGTNVRCYYCLRDGSFETTVLKDGQPVSRWVCVEHAFHQPKRVGRVSARLRSFVHPQFRLR